MYYFEVKVKREIADDDGNKKMKSQCFIVNAETFGEAEETIIKQLSCESHEMEVSNITKKQIDRVIIDEDFELHESFFLSVISIEEENKKGKISKRNDNILINAEDIKEAKDIADNEVKEYIDDAKLTRLIETNIIDVYL